MSYLTYRSGIDVVPNLPKCPVPVLTSYRLTKVSGTGIDDVPNLPKCPVPNLPKCPVPVLMSYWTYRSVRYRYWRRTERTEVSGTGIDVVPNLPKCPVPVLMLYRTYRSVGYRYWCSTELTEVSGTGMKVCTGTGGTGIDVVQNLSKYPVPVIPAVCLGTYRTEHTLRLRSQQYFWYDWQITSTHSTRKTLQRRTLQITHCQLEKCTTSPPRLFNAELRRQCQPLVLPLMPATNGP